MKSFKEYLIEVAKKRGQSVVTKNKDDLSTDKTLEHKAGDKVVALQADNATWKGGTVKRIGRTMIHVTHNDGTVSGYAPQHVKKEITSPLDEGKREDDKAAYLKHREEIKRLAAEKVKELDNAPDPTPEAKAKNDKILNSLLRNASKYKSIMGS